MLLDTKVVETEEDVCIVEEVPTLAVEIAGRLSVPVGKN
jgi:hypothetical protein